MAKLNALASFTQCNFTLEFNAHKGYYETAKEYYIERHGDEPLYDTVGDVDYDKDIWTVQVYPKTPIGFVAGISNELEPLIDWAMAAARDY